MTDPNAPPLPRFFMVFLAATVALAPFSMDAYIPAMPTMAEAFGADVVRMNHTMSTYLIGFGLGQLFGGPVSDQVGRRRIALIGLSVYLLATLGILLAHSVEQLMLLRAIQALGGGFTTITVLPMVRDVYPLTEVGRRYANVFLIMLLAPLVAPVVGVSLLHFFDWHAIFIFLFLYAASVWSLFVWVIPETRQNTRRLPDLRQIFPQYLAVIRHQVEGRRVSLRYGLTIALCGCVLMIYLTNASFIYQVYFGLPDRLFPMFFGVVVLGVMLCNWISMKRLSHMSMGATAAYFRVGIRLQLIAIALFALLVLVGQAQLWTALPCLVLAVSVLGIIQPSGSALYLSGFHRLSGSASALMTTTLFSLGGLIGALSSLLNKGSLTSVALTMLGVSLTANLIALSIPRLARDQPFPESAAPGY